MDQNKPYFGGEPSKPHKVPQGTQIDVVAMRKAVTESLQPILTALPVKIAEQIAKSVEGVAVHHTHVVDTKKLAKEIGDELIFPAPQVTVNAPDTVKLDQQTIDAIRQDDELAKSIERVVGELKKTNSNDPAEALRVLSKEMTANPKLWFNVRFTDGQKFLDKIGETIMVGMGGSNVAKDATLQAILHALAQPLTVTSTATTTTQDGRVGGDINTSSISEKVIIDECSLNTPASGHFPLAGGEVFDSGWIDTRGYAAIVLTAIDNTSGGAPFRLEEHWSTDASNDIFQAAAGIYLSGSAAGYGLQVLAGAKRTIFMRYVRYIWRMDTVDQGTGSPDTYNFSVFNVKLLPTPIPYDANIVNGSLPVVGNGATDSAPVLIGGFDLPSAPTLVNAAAVNSLGSLQVVGASTTLNSGGFLVVANRGNSTATLSNVTEATSSTQLAAAATGRRGFAVFNDTANVLILKFGTAASATSFTLKIAAGAYWEMSDPLYTGAVHGISAGTGGTWRVTTW